MGNDLIDGRRIEHILSPFADRFVKRIFTEMEQKSDKRFLKAPSYAKRFASKARGVSKSTWNRFRTGVFWRDMCNQPSVGKPTMALTGGALEQLEALTPDGMTAQIDLTITDDFPEAQAIVIIPAVPIMRTEDSNQLRTGLQRRPQRWTAKE